MECIRTFFRRRFNYESKLYPRFKSTLKEGEPQDGEGFKLDVMVAASGFKKSEQKTLEEVTNRTNFQLIAHLTPNSRQYMEAVKEREDRSDGGAEDKDEDMESEEEGDGEDEEMEEDDDDVDDGNDAADELDVNSMAHPEAEASIPPDAAGDSGAIPIAGPSTVSGNRRTSPMLDVKTSDYREQQDAMDSDNDNELDRELSPVSHSRPLSRSPPASRHSSQSPARSHSPSLADATAALSLSRDDRELRDRVAAEVSKRHAHQQKKYHSKRGAQRMGGRQKGSKAKMDTRYKPERGGLWD